jgi:hypothetical protein
MHVRDFKTRARQSAGIASRHIYTRGLAARIYAKHGHATRQVTRASSGTTSTGCDGIKKKLSVELKYTHRN